MTVLLCAVMVIANSLSAPAGSPLWQDDTSNLASGNNQVASGRGVKAQGHIPQDPQDLPLGVLVRITQPVPIPQPSGVNVSATKTLRLAQSPIKRPVISQPPVKVSLTSGKRVGVHATWYCSSRLRSRCTRGYSEYGYYAAISPDLKRWAGSRVRVWYGNRHVDVRIIDCNCQAHYAIDLYASAFRRLAPTSQGSMPVTLERI